MIITKEKIIEDYSLSEKQYIRLRVAIDTISHTYSEHKKAKRTLWTNALTSLENGKSFRFIMSVVNASRNVI